MPKTQITDYELFICVPKISHRFILGQLFQNLELQPIRDHLPFFVGANLIEKDFDWIIPP